MRMQLAQVIELVPDESGKKMRQQQRMPLTLGQKLHISSTDKAWFIDSQLEIEKIDRLLKTNF